MGGHLVDGAIQGEATFWKDLVQGMSALTRYQLDPDERRCRVTIEDDARASERSGPNRRS